MKGHRRRVTRRGIQITLGLLWILDGMLQLQPAMLTRAFAARVIAPAGDGQPAFVSWPVETVSRVIGHQPALADLAFAAIQLALGAGLLYPRTARRALIAPVAWALSVWYLGEGLGGLFGGGASLLTGAPGAALVYAVVALAAAPPRPDRTRAAGTPRTPRTAGTAGTAGTGGTGGSGGSAGSGGTAGGRPAPGGRRRRGPRSGSAGPSCSCCPEATPTTPSARPWR